MARRLTPAEENAFFKQREEREATTRANIKRRQAAITTPRKKRKKQPAFGASLSESIGHIRRRSPLEPRP